MTKFLVAAEFERDTGKPSHFRAWKETESTETAEAIANAFPKYVRVKASWFSTSEHASGGRIEFSVDFTKTNVQGDRNEAGIKRLKGFLERAGEIELVSDANTRSRYATLEEFLQAVGLDMPEARHEP